MEFIDKSGIAAALLCAACASDPTPEAPEVVEGSYNLTFTRFAFGAVEENGEPGDPRSSVGPARLDLRYGAAGVEATIAMASGFPTSVEAEVTPSQLRLTGPVEVAGIPCSHGELETWDRFTIPIHADGTLGTTFSAAGQGPGKYRGIEGNQIGVAVPMTASGSLEADVTPPSFSAKPGESFDGRHLPWRTFGWIAQEPVAQPGWEAGLSATAEVTGAPVLVEWSFTGTGKLLGGWSGVSVATGVLSEWEAASDQVVRFAVTGVADRAGNQGIAADAPWRVPRLGPVKQAHDFSLVEPLELGAWGNTRIVSGTDAALCEQDACLRIAPTSYGSRTTHGVAGRLHVQEASRVRLRYRVVSSSEHVDSFTVELGRPGSGEAGRGWFESELHEIEAQPDGIRFASDWADADVLMSGTGEVIGFAIFPTGSDEAMIDGMRSCDYDPVSPRPSPEILVQRVEAL